MRVIAIGALGAVLALGACQKKEEAAAPAAAATAPADYAVEANWLCKPGGAADACDFDQTATSVAADGTLSKVAYAANAAPAVDCFYLYPTASGDTGINSDLVPGEPGETTTARRQLAFLQNECRIFAPMYRSITLSAIRDPGGVTQEARDLAYGDVKAAWDYYMKNENKGRGVVLYSHSQGSGMLKRLLKDEIDGKPVQDQIIMAIPVGGGFLVADGKDVGGDTQSMPLCKKDGQTGCVIAYASYLDTAPPKDEEGYAGRRPDDKAGMQVACVNPAAIGGGKGMAHSRFNPKQIHPSAKPQPGWTADNKPIDTNYVETPGLITVECVKNGNLSYLSAHVNADPKDARTDVIEGEHYRDGVLQPKSGTHSMDVPVVLGDIAARVKSASAAWLAAHKS